MLRYKLRTLLILLAAGPPINQLPQAQSKSRLLFRADSPSALAKVRGPAPQKLGSLSEMFH